jgi:hypothetical protein
MMGLDDCLDLRRAFERPTLRAGRRQPTTTECPVSYRGEAGRTTRVSSCATPSRRKGHLFLLLGHWLGLSKVAASKARQTGPGRITTAQLAVAAGRFVSRKPLDVDAAAPELREIANGRGDLLAERAGITLGFYARENRDEWQRKAPEAALCIAGADLTRLMEWIAVGQERAERLR